MSALWHKVVRFPKKTMGYTMQFQCLFAVLMSVGVTSNAEPIGLVLSGGGARGAYEIGVWQELQAAGLSSRVRAISGTSVGALNAALFAVLPESAEKIWLEKMGEVFTINKNRVDESLEKTLDAASNAVEVAERTDSAKKGMAKFLSNLCVRVVDDYYKIKTSQEPRIGYIDSSKLAAALDDALPRTWSAVHPAVYVTAVEQGGGGVSKTWHLNVESHERRVLMLRASAAIPIGFDSVPIDGKSYVDGGWETEGGNNVPLKPILDHHPEIKTVIVVYLKDEKHLDVFRREKNRDAAVAAGVRLVEIMPSKNINGRFGIVGTFDTSPDTVHRLIELGRMDARKVLAR